LLLNSSKLVSAINSLINGGIVPESLFLIRFLFSQNGDRSIC
jgi:hypothetical protein